MGVLKKWMCLVLVWGLALCSVTMMGCASSTQLVESWQEPAFNDKPLKKILVLGVFNEDEIRRMYENKVVNAIGKDSAIAGYTLMPEVKDYDEKEEIIAAVKKSNADAVMIATMVGFEQKENYRAPEVVGYVPSLGLGHGVYDYYAVSYERVYDRGHTVKNTTVKLEATVFSAKTKKMVWAGSTKSVNLESRGKLVDDVAGLIVADMKKAELL